MVNRLRSGSFFYFFAIARKDALINDRPLRPGYAEIDKPHRLFIRTAVGTGNTRRTDSYITAV